MKKKFRVISKNEDGDIYFCVVLCEKESDITEEFNKHMILANKHNYNIIKLEEVQTANFNLKI